MTVIVNRPEINLQKKLNELDKPVGIGGQQVLQSNTVRDAQNVLGVGRKNLLLNSQFHINQRGEDVASGVTISGVNNYFTVDRWNEYHNGGVTRKVTINYNVQLPDGTMCNSYKSEHVSGAASWMHPVQQIPFENWMYGKTFAVSTWVKTSIPNFRMRVCDTTSCYLIGPVIPDDGEWHYVTGTVTFPDHGLNSSAVTQWQPAFGSGTMSTGDYIEFACMQVEVGTVATPFEWRTYGEELALCQRYYRMYKPPSSSYMPFLNGNTFASNQFQASYDATGMRDQPTLETSGTASDYQVYSGIGGQTATGVPYLDAQSRYPILDIRVPISGATAGQGAWLRVNNNSNAYLAFDAEVV